MKAFLASTITGPLIHKFLPLSTLFSEVIKDMTRAFSKLMLEDIATDKVL